ncbi:regulator of sigma E protease [Candidatus Magnetomoraceae bacterium gMMP-15]
MNSIVSFIIVLGILIFFHELGHFLCAKLFGVGVERFSLGFGPKIFGKTIGMTDYRISALPLGGYVKMVGEEPGEELKEEDIPMSFSHKALHQRMLIVAAGPFFNLILAFIIFVSFFYFAGMPTLLPNIGEVQKDSPAQKAGLQAGDIVTEINDNSVESWEDMAEIITESKGKPILITIKREDQFFDFQVRPKKISSHNLFGEEIDRYIIGIASARDVITKEMNIFQSIGEGAYQTWKITSLTIISIGKIIQGTLSSDNLGGPIMIAKMAGESAEAGFSHLLFFIAVISVSLAVFNFLPIPVLDGGHLLFFTIEAIIRRPVSIKVREISQQIGVFALLLLMVYVFYNDIIRYFFN